MSGRLKPGLQRGICHDPAQLRNLGRARQQPGLACHPEVR